MDEQRMEKVNQTFDLLIDRIQSEIKQGELDEGLVVATLRLFDFKEHVVAQEENRRMTSDLLGEITKHFRGGRRGQ